MKLQALLIETVDYFAKLFLYNFQKAELEWFLKQEVPKVLHPLEASISLCMKSSLLKSSSKLKLMCITSTRFVQHEL